MTEVSALEKHLYFDIDNYVNPWIPSNKLYLLPTLVSRFLGYRPSPQKEHPSPLLWVLTWVSTVAGLCLIGGIYATAPGIAKYHPPSMIASFGASAILHYSAISAPLAQPRNTLLGHTFSAIVGVAISKGFQQYHPHVFANYGWFPGAIACATASVVMSMTNTIHPPGGATAVLANTEGMIIAMGWMFVPLIILASCLMMAVALLFNNLLRHYPVYWWTGKDCGSKVRAAARKRREERTSKEDEDQSGGFDKAGDLEQQKDESDSERTLGRQMSKQVDVIDGGKAVSISSDKIFLPSYVALTEEEQVLLQRLQEKLRAHVEDDR